MYASVKPLFTNILDTNQYTQEMEVLLLGMKMRMDSDYLQLKNGSMRQKEVKNLNTAAATISMRLPGITTTAEKRHTP